MHGVPHGFFGGSRAQRLANEGFSGWGSPKSPYEQALFVKEVLPYLYLA